MSEDQMLCKVAALESQVEELQKQNTILTTCLKEVMMWIYNWDPTFTYDAEWENTLEKVRNSLGDKH